VQRSENSKQLAQIRTMLQNAHSDHAVKTHLTSACVCQKDH
jgi:hypothetical protein